MDEEGTSRHGKLGARRPSLAPCNAELDWVDKKRRPAGSLCDIGLDMGAFSLWTLSMAFMMCVNDRDLDRLSMTISVSRQNNQRYTMSASEFNNNCRRKCLRRAQLTSCISRSLASCMESSRNEWQEQNWLPR